MEITKIVAVNLRSLRDERKLTREKLARMANVSAQTVYDIENENKKPSLLVIESLAIALGVKASALLDADEPAPIKIIPASRMFIKLSSIPDDVYDAIFAAGELNEQDWDFIKSIAKNAKERNLSKKLKKDA